MAAAAGRPQRGDPCAEPPRRNRPRATRMILAPKAGGNQGSMTNQGEPGGALPRGGALRLASRGASETDTSLGEGPLLVIAVGGLDPSGGAGVVRDLLTARTFGAGVRI